MNKSNNIRYKTTEEYIQRALLRLLTRKDYNQITIKDICQEAGINRSSFYAHYIDINDLYIKYEESITQNILKIFENNQYNFETYKQLFEFIKENKVFYKAYLKSSGSFCERSMFNRFKNSLLKFAYSNNMFVADKEFEYRLCFFAAGLKSICEKWLNNNCTESPEQMSNLLKKEYSNIIKKVG